LKVAGIIKIYFENFHLELIFYNDEPFHITKHLGFTKQVNINNVLLNIEIQIKNFDNIHKHPVIKKPEQVERLHY
jgi:hypothetical protein